jgi:hypothetical protein
MLAHLRAGGVSPLDFWSVPHPALDASRFPDVADRRAATIGLPVHQGLRGRDIARLASLVLEKV